MTLRVRPPATGTDARKLAEVHVASWRIGHEGLYPPDVVDSVSVEEREREWLEVLTTASSETIVLVAERDEVVVGFATSGPVRDGSDARTAELYELFVDPPVIGAGIGHALLRETLKRLRRARFEIITLWIVEGNDLARRFYEREGLRPDGTRKRATFRGAEVIEVRYRASLEQLFGRPVTVTVAGSTARALGRARHGPV